MSNKLIGEFFGDYMNIKGFGCVNVNHISIISGIKWGTMKGASIFNVTIKGSGFEYISNERYYQDELTEKIQEILLAIKERE